MKLNPKMPTRKTLGIGKLVTICFPGGFAATAALILHGEQGVEEPQLASEVHTALG